MQLSGLHYINGQWQGQAGHTDTFNTLDATTFAPLAPLVRNATPAELELACQAATAAARWYSQQPLAFRAELLDAIADELNACPQLLARLATETALLRPRLEGELARTTGQLRAFANHLRHSQPADHVAPSATHAALVRLDLPLGPVAVFAASNFPLAFSVAGGDTASALAAGCPVVVKGHPAHAGGGELAMRAIERALLRLQVPVALVQLLQQNQAEFSHQLVAHHAIKAVSFTGSAAVGKALYRTAVARDTPIPFYGELGAINPQLVLPDFAPSTLETLAQQWLQAMTGSAGQLCTKPGLWLLPDNEIGAALLARIAELVRQQPAQSLLSPLFLQRYDTASALRSSQCSLWAHGHEAPKQARCNVWLARCSELVDVNWHDEIFGPCCQVVLYQHTDELMAVLNQLPGQLALSVHGDWQQQPHLVRACAARCGRLLLGQMPTGVAVHPLMMHGGPWPASTEPGDSAVGLTALERFVRPLCIQSAELADGLALTALLRAHHSGSI